MNTQITKFLAIDRYGQQYTLEYHGPKALCAFATPEKLINNLGHYEWNGTRLDAPTQNVFHLTPIDTTVLRIT